MKIALTHKALHVKDVEASVRFYRDWCGMNVSHSRKTDQAGGGKVYWMASPDYEDKFVIVLIPGAKKRPKEAQGVEHLGFAVEKKSDLTSLYNRAVREDCVHWPMMEMGDPVGTIFAVTDPDGNVIEFSYGQPIHFPAEKTGKQSKSAAPKPKR